MGALTPRCTPCVASLRTTFAWGHWRTPAFGGLVCRAAMICRTRAYRGLVLRVDMIRRPPRLRRARRVPRILRVAILFRFLGVPFTLSAVRLAADSDFVFACVPRAAARGYRLSSALPTRLRRLLRRTRHTLPQVFIALPGSTRTVTAQSGRLPSAAFQADTPCVASGLHCSTRTTTPHNASRRG